MDQKPLVLIFYTPGIQKAANLLFFDSLDRIITKKGGRLLVITNLKYLSTMGSSLHIFKDRHNSTAKAFGLYDPQNPLWHWVPGIEESEAFLPAFYVIAPDKQIVYHHIDYNFSLFNETELLHHSFVQQLLHSVETAVATIKLTIPVPIN